ncbi:hypothetical protein [Sorangium sp. So ce1000]|uniref:hypothetical protein n=1 Tax=Sorangium sp. So ce1000 TaxID=3133325 RepID=UPI003F60C844
MKPLPEPTLPALSFRMYDPEQVYAERIAQRQLAYLDNNVWIELRDARTAAATACRDACFAAVAAGKALFPLAFPSITEAIEIEEVTTKLRHCTLLDELSSGVTFRSPAILLKLEAWRASEWFFLGDERPLERTQVFTSVPDHLGEGTLSFPAGWTLSMLRKLADDMASDARMRSVRFIAEQGDWKQRHAAFRASYVDKMEALRARQRTRPKLPKQQAFARALLDERVALIKSYLLEGGAEHLFSILGPEKAASRISEVLAAKGTGGPERIHEICKRMPILDQHARLMAHDTLESNRKPQPQDFFDIDHATAPPVYADAFVTFDRRLARLVRSANRGGAKLLTSFNELIGWLEALR